MMIVCSRMCNYFRKRKSLLMVITVPSVLVLFKFVSDLLDPGIKMDATEPKYVTPPLSR